MINNQSGIGGSSNTRGQFQQFTANQLQGGGNAFQLGGNVPGLQNTLQGNYIPQNMQGILQGRGGGLGNLPSGAGQQPAGQSRFHNTQLPSNMSQFAHGIGRSNMVGFPAMNGLSGASPGPSARGPVGGAGSGLNAALGGPPMRPGTMDRSGLPPSAGLGLGNLGPGMQRGQGQAGVPQNLSLGGAGRSMGLGGPTAGGFGSGALPGGMNSALGLQSGSPRLHGAQMQQQQQQQHNASKDLLAMINKGAGGGAQQQGGSGQSSLLSGGAFGSSLQPGQGVGAALGHAAQHGQRGAPGQDGPDQLAFNASDFPALGGGGAGSAPQRPEVRDGALRGSSQHLQSLPNGNASSSAAPGSSYGAGAELYANMQLQKGQEPFSMQQEEFPALPGSAAPGSRVREAPGAQHEQATPSSQAPQTSAAQPQHKQQQQQPLTSPFLRASALGPPFQGPNGQQHDEASRRSFQDMPSGSMLPGLSGQASRPGQQHSQQDPTVLYAMQHQQQQHQRAPGRGQAASATSSEAAPGTSATPSSPQAADQYGLLGLLTVISMSDADVTTLALGTDLTTLGLHLNGVEPVYDTFASPWAEYPLRPDPDYKVPQYYRHKPPRLHPGYLSKFAQETLFYVFYSMPGDEAQIFAADELSVRGWWFHKEHKVWLKRLAPGDSGQKQIPVNSSSAYLIFDPSSWEVIRKDNIVVLLSDLERPPNLPRPGPASRENTGHLANMSMA